MAQFLHLIFQPQAYSSRSYQHAVLPEPVSKQPLGNEALHIAGGMLLTGLVHVVATLWLVRDDVPVDVSELCWTELLEGMGVEEGVVERRERVRKALRSAVRVVRIYWDQPLLWAPWVAFSA